MKREQKREEQIRFDQQKKKEEEHKLAEQIRIDQQKKKEEEQKLAEQIRFDQQKRKEEEQKLAEQMRIAQQIKMAEEMGLDEQMVLEQRLLEEQILLDEKQQARKAEKLLQQNDNNHIEQLEMMLEESTPTIPSLPGAVKGDDKINSLRAGLNDIINEVVTKLNTMHLVVNQTGDVMDLKPFLAKIKSIKADLSMAGEIYALQPLPKFIPPQTDDKLFFAKQLLNFEITNAKMHLGDVKIGMAASDPQGILTVARIIAKIRSQVNDM